ncbi:MAG: UDP-N-acetylmuramate--L-alanine ligase [Chloroflexi bacterium HGW-Chloroflexi-6]|nr:MAG: UDP-N-acetylmuramate--L-alanine ligase [Chloroflexi bacterium HGW-Chloroflexi-6]
MTHVHLIGIGGSGLSAIARLLLESGYVVTGSDRALSPLAADLQSIGVRVYVGHEAGQVSGADFVVRSSAIPDDNPEVQAALAAGIPVYKRADFLGKLMEGKIGIAIAGTHGKTTTTAMIAWMLSDLKLDPSFISGGVLSNLGVNARAGKGGAFVIEADEYDRMFLGLQPVYGIVTNIEHDHPDCYPTPAEFQAAFVEFASLIPKNGALIACAEDMGAIELMAEARRMGKRVVGYRISADGRTEAGEGAIARSLRPNAVGGFTFDAVVRLSGLVQYISSIELRVPGLHNARNALAALTVAGLMNLTLKDAAQSLAKFSGTGRRFEVKGEANGITIIDDYAHHPTEIRATLSAARARYPGKRIWACWQPHTYSRTQTLFDEFAISFNDADEVVVSEVYASREARQDFSAEQVVRAMRHPAVHFIAELDGIKEYLLEYLRPGDVLLVLSAGDADRVSRQVLATLQQRG